MSDVYQALTGQSPVIISAIAIFATLNTILIQFIMASRVVYGMANQGTLPSVLASVNPITRTPVLATALIITITAVLALAIPLDRLAETTSQLILFIWALANLALIFIKLRSEPIIDGNFYVPLWVPVVGLVFCAVFVGLSLLG